MTLGLLADVQLTQSGLKLLGTHFNVLLPVGGEGCLAGSIVECLVEGDQLLHQATAQVFTQLLVGNRQLRVLLHQTVQTLVDILQLKTVAVVELAHSYIG